MNAIQIDCKGSKAGFALMIALSLMAFLVLLILGLWSRRVMRLPGPMRGSRAVGFSGREGQSEGMGLIPLDISEESIPRGNVRIFNVSQVPLAGKVIETKKILAPLESMLVPIGKSQLDTRFAIQEGEDWQLVYSQNRTVRKSRRYVFLMIPTGTNTGYQMVRVVL